MSFWGCEVTETKAAVVVVPEGFVLNVVNATCSASNADDAQLALALETQQLNGNAWKGAVAHLGNQQPLQVKLDLVFGHKVKFYLSKGVGAVNLTGYFQPGPPIELLEEAQPTETSTKKSKKRSRDEKTDKSWDQVSSSDSEEAPAKEAKPTKPTKPAAPTVTPTPAKEEEKKHADANATVNGGAAHSGKKKRKKNRKAKSAATGAAN